MIRSLCQMLVYDRAVQSADRDRKLLVFRIYLLSDKSSQLLCVPVGKMIKTKPLFLLFGHFSDFFVIHFTHDTLLLSFRFSYLSGYFVPFHEHFFHHFVKNGMYDLCSVKTIRNLLPDSSLACTDRTDPLQQFPEIVFAKSCFPLFQPFIIQCKTLYHVLKRELSHNFTRVLLSVQNLRIATLYLLHTPP